MKRWIRIVLTVLTALVGITAIAGGVALIIGAATSSSVGGAVPDRSYLGGSPFTSFIVPGLVLAVIVGGTHLLASLLVGRGSPSGAFATAVAGFGLLIWIFVQMMFIPFSVLQAIYFAAGLAELGFVLLGLGLLRRDRAVTT
ncbi:hypothetical protein [uncultured Leifsonia sp.]|uniref:hypothetical protein n=1 Tax=uncultured Leifsonia sp. TaxID=340359 RepID=UPI0025DF9947|nr:hypothetical protein [uncultured Leifsonia sp.]